MDTDWYIKYEDKWQLDYKLLKTEMMIFVEDLNLRLIYLLVSFCKFVKFVDHLDKWLWDFTEITNC